MATPKTNKQQLVEESSFDTTMSFRRSGRDQKPSRQQKIFKLMERVTKLKKDTAEILRKFREEYVPPEPKEFCKPTPRKRGPRKVKNEVAIPTGKITRISIGAR